MENQKSPECELTCLLNLSTEPCQENLSIEPAQDAPGGRHAGLLPENGKIKTETENRAPVDETAPAVAAQNSDYQGNRQATKPGKKPWVPNGTGKFAKGFTQKPSSNTPSIISPGQDLANWYFTLIGEPKREAAAVKTTWAGIFAPAIAAHGIEWVKVRMQWASDDPWWADKLALDRACSATMAVKKLDIWDSLRFSQLEKAATQKKKPSTPVAHPPTVQPQPVSRRPLGVDPTW
jgi:hypothetical protein